MDIGIKILILTVIGGIIGWITNILAIKLLFRPIKPIKIPLLNIEIMGLIPKRRDEIAKNISEVVETELISVDELIDSAIKDEDKIEIANMVKDKIKDIINQKMDFIPYMFRSLISGSIESLINDEVDSSIDDIKDKIVEKAKKRIDIKEIVEEKIKALDLKELEEIIINIAKKELKHIELLGLFLGAAIGLIQGIIIVLL